MDTLQLILGAYLLGSIPTGKIIARIFYKVDIQRRGSGNIGFANVRRTLGWRAGLITLAGDILKGFLPAAVGLIWTHSPELAFAVGFAAIVGHIFPIWLRFKGGKGIATGLGVLLALAPLAAAAGSVTYILAGLVLNKSSHGSVAGILMASIVGVATSPLAWWAYVVLIVVATWTLRDNLRGTVANYDT